MQYKSCNSSEYLNYKNYKCRKRLVNKLIDKCTETIAQVRIVSESKIKCNSCILYIALFSIFFTINVGIDSYFVYYKYVNYN